MKWRLRAHCPARNGPRATLLMLMIASACAVMVPLPAAADVATESSDTDDVAWQTVKVPDTKLSLTYPQGWVNGDDIVRQRHADQPGDLLFAAGSTLNGDNLIVNRFRGKLAYWYSGLREYKALMKASADFSDGELLRASKTKVGVLPAFRHTETYVDPQSNQRVIYADIEIRGKDRSILDVVVNVNADEPGARATAEAILDSVKFG